MSLALIALICASPTQAEESQAQSEGSSHSPLFVVTAIVDPTCEPIVAGFAEWIRLRASEAGLSVVPGSSARRSIEKALRGPASSSAANSNGDVVLDQSQLMQVAREHAARHALLIDLRSRHGMIEADFRLYDVSSERLTGSGLVDAPARLLVPETEQALGMIDERLGAMPPARTPQELRLLDLGALAAAGRALDRLDQQQIGEAWREVAGRSNPLARAIVAEIDRLASAPTTTGTQLAQIESAKGQNERAWQHISELARESYSSPSGSIRTLITAAEVQLSLGAASKARSFYKKVLEVEPNNAGATFGMARVLALERHPDQARAMFDLAAALDPDSPEPLELAAEVSAGDSTLRAEYLLKAGERHAARFDAGPAQSNFARAVKLDTRVEARAARASGDLHAKVGEFDDALRQYDHVRKVGREEPSLLVVEARAQHASGMTTQAVASYEKVLHDYDEDHSETLVELGALYVDEGRTAEAIPLLEAARARDPKASKTDRILARALTARNGDNDRARALELLVESERAGNGDARDLRAMAKLQAEGGDFAAASKTLERAVAVRELDAEVQRDIVALMNAQGNAKAGNVWEERFTKSGIDDAVGESLDAAAGEAIGLEERFEELDQLVASFGATKQASVDAAFQVLREPMEPGELVLDWLMPRTTDVEALTRAINSALQASYNVIDPTTLGDNFAREVESLFRFDEKTSLRASTIVDLNITYNTHAVFAARLLRLPGDPAAPHGSCWSTNHYELQMRRLSGQTDEGAQVLSNRSCVAGGIDGEFGIHNYKALLPYSLMLIFIVFPFARGWGKLEVDFVLPVGSAAMFAVSLTRRPSKVRDRSTRTRAAATNVFRNQLRRISRFERRLEGSHMSFSWVPARRSHYYLTIRGPLVDLSTNSLIGECLEERIIKVERGKVTRFDFDLCPREAMVNVVVQSGGGRVPRACVALRGVPGSARFCPQGKGAIYVPMGEHVLVVGADDRVAEQLISIQGVAPVTITFNLDYEFVFEGCPDAVEPYLEADFVTASRALVEAGLGSVASEVARLRDVSRPTVSAEAEADAAPAPQIAGVSQVLERSREATAEAAQVHDGAGEYALAAEDYRQIRDLVNAARCYEEVYDWQNAIECYQDLGDTESLMCLLERSGEFYEAGTLAAEAQQIDRAIHDFQQVDARHPRYTECCRKLAEVLNARGEVDLALEKFDEGLALTGTTEAPLSMLSSYASLLENAERIEEALGIYEGIRRRDNRFADINENIERLRKQLSQKSQAADDPTVMFPPTRTSPAQSRYEIQAELGRGGMGVVYRALDTHLQRTVALKVLPEHLREHKAALALFLREARSAAALNHRNIVTVYDAGQEGAMDFISMECLEGAGLDAILKRRGALPSQAVASIGLQVAAGLDYAQKRKIIHRDIKPSNLFLTTERIVKIMDFGLAKMVEEVRRASTIIGGTPNYMAPEQALGNPTDHRADLYAMGGTLFHLVTGTVPYETGDVTYQHAHAPAPDPRERVATVEPRMAQLVMKLMAKAPEDRYQSAREVAVDISPPSRNQ